MPLGQTEKQKLDEAECIRHLSIIITTHALLNTLIVAQNLN